MLDQKVFTAFKDDGSEVIRVLRRGRRARCDSIIYNPATGLIMFDRNGNGAAAAVQFAQVDSGVKVSTTDFYIV